MIQPEEDEGIVVDVPHDKQPIKGDKKKTTKKGNIKKGSTKKKKGGTTLKPLVVPADWAKKCSKDSSWCLKFIMNLFDNYKQNLISLFPKFKDKSLTQEELNDINAKCNNNETLCETMKQAQERNESIQELFKSARSYNLTSHKSSNSWIWIIVVIFLLLIVVTVVYIYWHFSHKPNRSKGGREAKSGNQKSLRGSLRRSLTKSKSKSKARFSGSRASESKRSIHTLKSKARLSGSKPSEFKSKRSVKSSKSKRQLSSSKK
ncbi:hypothetical protein RDWZM_004591 [Blomia tropicalis]|uniref:Uncharacterized protein n=1 Tax=Blomia tropicalis TaxID=40697 RepID=A0A9Q0M4J0_BLOTA|nr:hypothetical protein RDWZM_004591 [Blomia tropicalis]